jgi:hypothetical protein
MKVDETNTPYHHFIIHEFFPKNIYEDIIKYFENNQEWVKYTSRPCRYASDLIELPHAYDFIESNIYNIISICKNDLEFRQKGLSTRKMKLREAKICKDIQGYSIPSHCDTSSKTITIVVYINARGSTTTLYDKNKDNPHDIQCCPNSALVFVPLNNGSWHEVKETNEIRHTIQMSFGL